MNFKIAIILAVVAVASAQTTGDYYTEGPSGRPSDRPTGGPTERPTGRPSDRPSEGPTGGPTDRPSDRPSERPTGGPTGRPSDRPSEGPTGGPTDRPSDRPSEGPTGGPTNRPSDRPSEGPTDGPTVPQTETTANPGLPFGSVCNGLLLRCNRYSETVACVQRRSDPETTPEPGTENPLLSLFRQGKPQDVCQVGIGATLGRCQCQRNCKDGVYVEDGEFDEERQRCVGLVGSTCSIFVPQCTQHAHCNFVASKCVCDTDYREDESKRCVPN